MMVNAVEHFMSNNTGWYTSRGGVILEFGQRSLINAFAWDDNRDDMWEFCIVRPSSLTVRLSYVSIQGRLVYIL